MQYKVIAINHLDGKPRTEGRYPLRIGRRCTFFFFPEEGCCLYIHWLTDRDGSRYDGVMRTSLVQNVSKKMDVLRVQTQNSIYIFQCLRNTENS